MVAEILVADGLAGTDSDGVCAGRTGLGFDEPWLQDLGERISARGDAS